MRCRPASLLVRLALPVALAAAALLLPRPGLAGFPSNDNPNADQQAAVRFVCADDPSVQCVDADPDGIATGAECPAPPADPVCVPDYVDGEIRGILTVLADDRDGQGDVRTAVVFDFKIGDALFVLADTFESEIGGWNPIFTEDEIESFDFVGGTLFQENLADLGSRVRALAEQELGIPAGTVPVVVEGVVATSDSLSSATVRKAPGRDASDPADATASVARYRITVRFALPR